MILLLKRISLFAGFSDQELEKIREVCEGTFVKKGETIFREGDIGEKCYMILKGEVRISKHIPNIGEEALAVLHEGDYFGEMALIDEFPRSAYAIANTDASLIVLKKEDLDSIFTTDRELGFKFFQAFARTLSRRLREMNDKMAGFLAIASGF